jgi:hypothetical protein
VPGNLSSKSGVGVNRHQLKDLGMNEILHKKVSPPFEGGVVGTIDYLIYTVFYFPTGVVACN